MRVEAILGCEGVPPEDYPEDLRSCHFCESGSAGTFEISGHWLERYMALSDDFYSGDLIRLLDEINERGIIPACRRGGVRYCTGSIIVTREG